jgi:hypothetical protein
MLTDATGGGMANDGRVGCSALMKVGKPTTVSGLYDLQGTGAVLAAAS